MSDALERICRDKAAFVADRKTQRSVSELAKRARDATPPRGFKDALAHAVQRGRWGLIAEIKKASPSKGLIREDFDPPALAQAYAAGGATCLSVLTDEPYFQGSDAYLKAARAVVTLPVLRKDFMIDPYQIVESRVIGADCVLLIMAALSDAGAAELNDAAGEWGMDVLVEVHDAAEMARAVALKPSLIGVNNRNLKTLEVELSTSEQLAAMLPEDALAVCESGLNLPEDLARMERSGFSCFLVGESLMRQDDVQAATRALLTKPADPSAVQGGS
jgi:indole-3-glycerol phosphate synthase